MSDPVYRVLSLFLLSRLERDGSLAAWSDTILSGSALVTGNVRVDGDLQLASAANLIVLGDLEVTGALVTELDYPCCFVGGQLRVRDYAACEAETIALGGLVASRSVLIVFNHTILIAPRVESHVLATEDAYLSAELTSEVRLEDPSPDQYRLQFGLAPEVVQSEDFDVYAAVTQSLLRR